jgi:hypothetical protein
LEVGAPFAAAKPRTRHFLGPPLGLRFAPAQSPACCTDLLTGVAGSLSPRAWGRQHNCARQCALSHRWAGAGAFGLRHCQMRSGSTASSALGGGPGSGGNARVKGRARRLSPRATPSSAVALPPIRSPSADCSTWKCNRRASRTSSPAAVSRLVRRRSSTRARVPLTAIGSRRPPRSG